MIDFLIRKMGYVKKSEIDNKLNFARDISKRLDEHREVVEAIEQKTVLFRQAEWHSWHMATQDDYLMRIFYLVNGEWPENSNRWRVRPRPEILGACRLPEYQGD